MTTKSILIEPVLNGYKIRKQDESKYRIDCNESEYVFHHFEDLVRFLARHIASLDEKQQILSLLGEE